MSWQSIIKMFSDYNGRLSREAFVVAYGSLLIIRILILAIFKFDTFNLNLVFSFFASILLLALFFFIPLFFWIFAYAVITKRFHDLNLPGWYLYILVFIPYLVFLFWSLVLEDLAFIAFIALLFFLSLFFIFMSFWISAYVVLIKRLRNLNLPGWYLYIAVLIFLLGLIFLFLLQEDPSLDSTALPFFLFFIFMSFWISAYVVLIKRFHNLNLPGWYLYIAALILFLMLIFLLRSFYAAIYLLFGWYLLILLLEFLLLPFLILAKGNPKINKYGEPPLPFKGPSFVLFGSYALIGLYILTFGFFLINSEWVKGMWVLVKR